MQHISIDPRRPLRYRIGIRKRLLAIALLTATIIATAALFRVRDEVGELGSLGYLGVFLLALIGNAIVAVPFPWVFPVAALGATYSPIGIAAVAAVGATVGAIVPYIVGAGVRRSAVPEWLAGRLESLSGLRKSLVLVALAVSPVFSYPGLAAGMLRYPAWATLAITFVTEGMKVWLFVGGATYIYRLRVF